MHHNFRVVIFCLFLSLPLFVAGQGTGNSPFSQFGLGDLTFNNGNVRNMGMGYAGVSSRHHYFVNLANPALLPNNRTPKKPRPNHTYKYWDYYRNQTIDSTVKLEFAVTYQQIGVQTTKGNQSTGGMNLSYLTFALPLTKTWATAIGIQPYSTVNYGLSYSAPVTGNPSVSTQTSNSGRGGIYKIFWSNGVGITQNLSVGLETSLLYGNINQDNSSTISDFSVQSFGFKRRNSYSGVNFKPGINFRKEIIKVYHDTVPELDSTGEVIRKKLVRKTKSSGIFYNIGLTYDLNASMRVRQDLNLYNINTSNVITMDTTIASGKYKAQLPPVVRLGFSLDVPLRWSVSADVFYGAWSVYKPNIPNYTDTMANSYGFNIGGEFAPGPMKLRSKTFRLGFSYIKTPVIYMGTQLEDLSVSIGATIPFGRRSPTTPVIPRVNVAVIGGQRGDLKTFGIREQYLKFQLGILINEKWFNKRKIY